MVGIFVLGRRSAWSVGASVLPKVGNSHDWPSLPAGAQNCLQSLTAQITSGEIYDPVLFFNSGCQFSTAVMGDVGVFSWPAHDFTRNPLPSGR
jgi:hypothetical protein